MNLPLNNTILIWLSNFFVLFSLYIHKNHNYNKDNYKSFSLLNWYILWNILNIIRGLFIAESYWDWKGLITNSTALLLPISAFVFTNKHTTQYLLSSYIKYILPSFLLISFFIDKDAYGFYLAPLSLMILFFPTFTKKWKIVIIIILIIVLTANLGARSNIIKFGVPAILVLTYYLKHFINKRIIWFTAKLFLVLPFILFTLGVNGVFNIFKIEEYVKVDIKEIKFEENGVSKIENLKADTRTFLYKEVLVTASKYNTWLIGRSPARGNDTEAFAEIAQITGKKERLANEVAILNIFTWTGIIGVILYLFVFYHASFLAVNFSNNYYSKLLGLFISFRWTYAWVEDINNFSLSYMMLWCIIGLGYSKSFRSMTDKEVKFWVRSIFQGNQTNKVNKTSKTAYSFNLQ
ncbi:hypothetical protein [Telluribacter sp. SYSU D00476]|uniref:hypothetical protein n=1 Tax=Telluribacter sp. SYSU D00476 TaxID=2811430 RepID=UPI001FF51B92|nr:hypothetical protein [Telluribacter sp. SYSU D00476]